MSDYRGISGAWMVYDYDNGPYVEAIYPSAESAAVGSARCGHGRIGFLPFGVELRDAVRLWEEGK